MNVMDNRVCNVHRGFLERVTDCTDVFCASSTRNPRPPSLASPLHMKSVTSRDPRIRDCSIPDSRLVKARVATWRARYSELVELRARDSPNEVDASTFQVPTRRLKLRCHETLDRRSSTQTLSTPQIWIMGTRGEWRPCLSCPSISAGSPSEYAGSGTAHGSNIALP